MFRRIVHKIPFPEAPHLPSTLQAFNFIAERVQQTSYPRRFYDSYKECLSIDQSQQNRNSSEIPTQDLHPIVEKQKLTP